MRALSFAVVASLALVACGGGDGGTDTLAPLPTPAGATTTTVVVDTTLTPLVTTTTAPSTSSTSVSPTTTTVPPGLELVLRNDGLGDVLFGVAPEGAVSYVSSLLGAPNRDTGWGSNVSDYGVCPGTRFRAVVWGDLALFFGDQSEFANGVDHFWGWQYGPVTDVEAVPAGPATDGLVTIGTKVGEIVRVYPSAEIFTDEVFGARFELEPFLGGALSDDSPNGEVQALYGGIVCGE